MSYTTVSQWNYNIIHKHAFQGLNCDTLKMLSLDDETIADLIVVGNLVIQTSLVYPA